MIEIGAKIPNVTLKYCPYLKDADKKACGIVQKVNSHDFFKGKKAVVFAVPGAFTPTCHNTHLADFIKSADQLKSKGVDVIACLATNDPWVMDGWGKCLDVNGKIEMMSDDTAAFVKEIGLTQAPGGALLRAKRFAMIIDDLKVKYVGVDENGVKDSGVANILSKI